MTNAKGQEISEWKYEVVTLPKIWTKKFEKFCPEVYIVQCTFTIRNQILKSLCIEVSKRGFQLMQIPDLLCMYFGAAIIVIMKFSILFRWALAIHSKETDVPLEIIRTHCGRDPPSKRMTFIHISPCCKGESSALG